MSRMRKELERVTPEEVGIHSRDIYHLIDVLDTCGTQMHGIMILRHNKVCAEGWWSPYAPGLRHGCQSLTKTYTSTAIGLLYDEGLVKLDEKLVDIFPEYVPENPGKFLDRVTVKDCLCMAVGMYRMPDVSSENWMKEYFTIPIEKEPGKETFFYNSATSAVLSAIVKKKTGCDMIEYLRPRLFDKIGIDADNLRIIKMPDGVDNGGGGLYSTTEDNARLMLLYLNHGMWEGERILSEEWIQMATSFQNSTVEDKGIQDCHVGYGFQMWMCKPAGVYRADGAYGQYAIVFPKLDMVIAINETAKLGIWPQQVLDIIWEEFMPRVEETAQSYESNREEYEQLKKRLRSLTLDKPRVMPISPLAKENACLTYQLEENEITLMPEIYHHICGVPRRKVDTVEFRFAGNNVMQLSFAYGDGRVEFQVGLDGNGRINESLFPESICQMTYCSGYWENEEELVVCVNYLETCFEKEFHFCFRGNDFVLSVAENNTSIDNHGEKKLVVNGTSAKKVSDGANPEMERRANAILEELLKRIPKAVQENPAHRAVISVYGGSGAGKTTIAGLLAGHLDSLGMKCCTVSGDNYPCRIPKYNDAERLHIFRESGIKGMIRDGVYTEETKELIEKLQKADKDSESEFLKQYAWFASYYTAGRDGLKHYLGTPREIEFEEINTVIEKFKSGAEELWLKKLGRTEAELCYEKVNLKECNILLVDWTHGNSECLKGIDIPVFLDSTPQETMEYRKRRNRDAGADSSFTTMVLQVEQELLQTQIQNAKIIVTQDGRISL